MLLLAFIVFTNKTDKLEKNLLAAVDELLFSKSTTERSFIH